jgi:Glycosyltransferase family 87
MPNKSRRGASVLPAVLLFVIAIVIALLYGLSHPVYDFVEYWTAAHLLVSHHNPYSLGEMFQAEKSLGMYQSVPLMFLSPPWVLALLAPLGFAKSYVIAWFAWTGVLVAAIAMSSRLLMDVYFGELCIPEVSDKASYRALFAFTFYPILLSLKFTQTAPLMLLGVAGFIYFENRRRPVWAGIFLSLTLIKPHLTYLLWIALLLWSWRQRRWKTLTSTILFTVFLTVLTLPFDPHVIQHYRELATGPYMEIYPSGVTGGIRKLLGGIGTFWIEFVPPLIGLVWFANHWRRHRGSWSWTDRLPMLITVSVVTSAYGWLFDQSLLVLTVIYLAAQATRSFGRIPGNLVLIYTALNCLLMIMWPLPSFGLLPAPVMLLMLLHRDACRSRELVPVSAMGDYDRN